jgi:hypothetical protein
MWATLALLAMTSATPAQGGSINLSNVRITHGILGPTRGDNKFLPADRLQLTWDATGVQFSADGKYSYSMGMEVTDSKGKSMYKQAPREQDVFYTLGGDRIPLFAHVDVGADLPPGEYTVVVSVIDGKTKKSESITQKFEVLPKDFGLVRLQITDVQSATSTAPLAVPGQDQTVNFFATGFSRSKQTNQPDVDVEMRVYDEANKPTLSKPFTGRVNADVPANVQAIPMSFLLRNNRAGKFTVELKATDKISNKTAKLTFPVTVLEQK